MIDGESPYSSWFSKTAAPPGGHFYIMSAILKFVYVNNFRAVCRNSTKLHTNDRWWEMPAPANFRTCLPTVAPPVGHLFFILYFFLLILKNVWRNSMHLHINDRWEKTQRPACFRTSSPTAVPSSGHFSFRYWLFVLMLKTVWRISMKLHMNGRWWELPKAADFRKHSSWAVPSGGHFYFTSAILKFFYVNNFKDASRNSTKLHTSNRWWVMPTTVDFPWATVAPPVGHFYQIFTFFLLIFKTVWPKLTELHIIDREKTQHQPVFEPAGPPQRPLVDIFILDFDSLSCSKLFNGFQRNFTRMIDGGSCLLQLIFKNTCPQQRPLAAFLFWHFYDYFQNQLMDFNETSHIWLMQGDVFSCWFSEMIA